MSLNLRCSIRKTPFGPRHSDTGFTQPRPQLEPCRQPRSAACPLKLTPLPVAHIFARSRSHYSCANQAFLLDKMLKCQHLF